jgi:biopolymer transport protein ExbD
MKVKLRKQFHSEVATASLNDIMFFLLLFFLIVSTVANPNVIKVLLPRSAASKALTKQPVTLTITEDKVYYINKTRVNEAQLEQKLVEACGQMTEPTVVLRVAATLTVQDLVDVMQIGAKKKIKMVLSTQKI